MNKRIPTLVLRAVIILSAVAGVLLCVFAIPTFGQSIAKNFPNFAFWQYPILVGLYAAAGCLFYALLRFWFLLDGVDRDGTFLGKHLKAIRRCAAVFSILYFIFAMPVIYLAADAGDAPGLILIGAFLDTIPIGVAAFTAILERNAG